MGFFSRKKKKVEAPAKIEKLDEAWENVPVWIDADKEDVEIVSIITTVIAAGNKSESDFTVKKVWQRNPEAELVSVITAALATVTEENKLSIKSIKRRKDNVT